MMADGEEELLLKKPRPRPAPGADNGTPPSPPPRLQEIRRMVSQRNHEITRVLVLESAVNAQADAQKEKERRDAQLRATAKQQDSNLPARITFLPLSRRFKLHAEKIATEHREGKGVPTIVESFGNPLFNATISNGEEVYQRIVECFQVFPEPATPFQWEIFSATMSACAPIIIGSAFFMDPARWMRLIGGRFTDGVVGILTGRKTGKSTGLAYVIITLMLNISSFQAIVSSKTLEQAKIILTTVKALIQRHPHFRGKGYTVEESRATCFVIKSTNDGTLRRLESRCGNGEVRSCYSIRERGSGQTSKKVRSSIITL